jgi:hypothetical protein
MLLYNVGLNKLQQVSRTDKLLPLVRLLVTFEPCWCHAMRHAMAFATGSTMKMPFPAKRAFGSFQNTRTREPAFQGWRRCRRIGHHRKNVKLT